MELQANQGIVDDLFRRGFINQEARDCVLELLYPHLNWGAFASRFLGVLGALLILSGLVFYFSFNWQNMSGSYKLNTIEAGFFLCIAGAWTFSLSKLSGQLFLTSSCILIGIFMAVFGQVYQTGADSYQLFALWSLLIVPLVFISRFAALWYLWFILINVAFSLYWVQVVNISANSAYLLFLILILFDVCVLALREYAQSKMIIWCQGRWHRVLLVLSILLLTMYPITELIFNFDQWHNPYLSASALLGIIVQLGFVYFYRCKKVDMWAVGLTIISLCIILCLCGFELLFSKKITSSEITWLVISVATLIIFSIGAFVLNKLRPKLTYQEKIS